MKPVIIVAGLMLTASLFGNYLWVKDLREDAAKRDACAKANDVYECVFVPQPAEPHRIVYRQADLLPPPVL